MGIEGQHWEAFPAKPHLLSFSKELLELSVHHQIPSLRNLIIKDETCPNSIVERLNVSSSVSLKSKTK